jgi:hypothetical protein
VDSLKALDPKPPIREADTVLLFDGDNRNAAEIARAASKKLVFDCDARRGSNHCFWHRHWKSAPQNGVPS